MTSTLNLLLARAATVQRRAPTLNNSWAKRIPSLPTAPLTMAEPATIAGRRAIVSQGIATAMPAGSIAMPLMPSSAFHGLLGANPALQRWASYQYGPDGVTPVLNWHNIQLEDLKALPPTDRELLVLDALMHHSKALRPRNSSSCGKGKLSTRSKKFLRRGQHAKRSAQRRRRHARSPSAAARNVNMLRIESDAQIQDNNDYDFESLEESAAHLHTAILERGRQILRANLKRSSSQ